MASVIVGNLAGVLNFQVRRGDKIGPVSLAWGSTVDLSDRTWAAQVRTNLDEPADVTATFVVDTEGAPGGTLVLTLPHSESAKLVTGEAGGFDPGKGTYYWDLQATRTDDAEDVFTWLAGQVKVTGDVTL